MKTKNIKQLDKLDKRGGRRSRKRTGGASRDDDGDYGGGGGGGGGGVVVKCDDSFSLSLVVLPRDEYQMLTFGTTCGARRQARAEVGQGEELVGVVSPSTPGSCFSKNGMLAG